MARPGDQSDDQTFTAFDRDRDQPRITSGQPGRRNRGQVLAHRLAVHPQALRNLDLGPARVPVHVISIRSTISNVLLAI